MKAKPTAAPMNAGHPNTSEAQIRPFELPAEALVRRCDPRSLGFETTAELPDLQSVIGQPRAIRALELGSEVAGPGYNIFVLGLPGSGRTTLTLEHLKRKAISEPVPDDWCYVFNFESPHEPVALRLPAGQGVALRKDMEDLIAYAEREIERAFESKEFLEERDRLVNWLKKTQELEFARLQEHVERYQFLLVRTPFGVVLTPGLEGKPLKPEELERLTEDQRAKIEQLAVRLGQEVEKTLKRLREAAQATAEKLNDLNARTVLFIIGPQMEVLKEKYAGQEGTLAYLEAVQNDLVRNSGRFSPEEAGRSGLQAGEGRWLDRYEVNVLVDNSDCKGAPVILESNPVYHNLLGRIEHEVIMGATRTNFKMIRAGAVHRANGGYLVLPARDLLLSPYAWDGLKRVLRDGAIRIMDLGSQIGLVSTVTLDPQPIPLDIKIVLIGTPLLYYLLQAYEEDFAKLFKVRAEFASLMDRSPETEREYGLFIRSVVDDNHLPPFDCGAVARIIEWSARMAEDQNKLSTRFGKIADLAREAGYWARKRSGDHFAPRDSASLATRNHQAPETSQAEPADPAQPTGGVQEAQASATPDAGMVVTAEDVRQAIKEMEYRNNLLEERLQELIEQGTLMIDVQGAVVGQVNALSVLLLGDYAFGRPCRLTATVYPGQAGVIDIERQAKLGGPVHTKGVLIISGFLGERYGQRQRLTLNASITFEQSYDEIEGDSASAAELCALISALADVPLRQDRAITGSVNQHGQIQAIGGVNEKIEGFFAACRARGLTGEQGVIIPAANQRNLMLNEEVVSAVASGEFHVWSVQTIDEALRLLTGCEPGELQEDGSYPAGSLNRAVVERLEVFTKIGAPSKANEDDA